MKSKVETKNNEMTARTMLLQGDEAVVEGGLVAGASFFAR